MIGRYPDISLKDARDLARKDRAQHQRGVDVGAVKRKERFTLLRRGARLATLSHTEDLSTALMVEAAELAEVFQWMTPEESREAHLTPASKQHIGEEVADVLLYLLQVADDCQIDVGTAVRDKLARNALKYRKRSANDTLAPLKTTC